jgi:hypothetical protein
VEGVSWNDAVEFCKKLSELPAEKAAQRRYCLPTEAQWEYACRAGTTTRWYTGDDQRPFRESAWLIGPFQTHPVAQKPANAWGLHDMGGIVWQWCQDWYDAAYYSKSPEQDPVGPPEGQFRVLRGGTWFHYSPWTCRSAYRFRGDPRSTNLLRGLRVALLIDEGRPPVAAPTAPKIPAASDRDDAWTDWKDLFDGKTLNGWKQETKGKFGIGGVKIENGHLELSREGDGDFGAAIAATGTVPRTNYEIQMEAMRVSGRDFADIHFPVGDGDCELLIGGYAGRVVGIEGLDSKGAVDNETVRRMTFEANRWYTVTLRVTDDRIQAWLDTDKVIDLPRGGHKFYDPYLANSWDAPLGVYAWNAHAAIRSIRMRQLKSTAGTTSKVNSGPQSAASNIPAATPPAAPREVDLLKLVDPLRDAVLGNWHKSDATIGCGTFQWARIEIPFEPPQEYDFRIVFRTNGAARGVSQLCFAGGRQFEFVIGGLLNKVSGFGNINGRVVNRTATATTADHWLVAGQRHVSLVKVRKEGVQGWFDNKLVTEHKTNFSDMSIHPHWKLHRTNSIGIGANTDISVESATVTEISGEGKMLLPAAQSGQKDALLPGTLWKGKRSYRKGGYQGVTVTYELHVVKRDGPKFTGFVFDNGPNRNRAEVEGEVNGTTITWRERAAGNVLTMESQLDGDTLSVSFTGKYANGVTNQGDGTLKLAN